MFKKGQADAGLMILFSVILVIMVIIVAVVLIIADREKEQELVTKGEDLSLTKSTLVSFLRTRNTDINFGDLVVLAINDDIKREELHGSLEDFFEDTDYYYLLSVESSKGKYVLTRKDFTPLSLGQIQLSLGIHYAVVPSFEDGDVKVGLSIVKGGADE